MAGDFHTISCNVCMCLLQNFLCIRHRQWDPAEKSLVLSLLNIMGYFVGLVKRKQISQAGPWETPRQLKGKEKSLKEKRILDFQSFMMPLRAVKEANAQILDHPLKARLTHRSKERHSSLTATSWPSTNSSPKLSRKTYFSKAACAMAKQPLQLLPAQCFYRWVPKLKSESHRHQASVQSCHLLQQLLVLLPHTKANEASHREVAKSFFCQPTPNADDLVNLEEDQNSENNGQKKKAYFSSTFSEVILVSKPLTSMQTHTLTKWARNTQSKM